MQLTRAADYAIRAMIHLASAPPGKRVSSSELADAAAVSETFLSKVLQKLVTRGLVVSYRGQGGGFQLGMPAAEISVLEVVEAIEGPIALNCCTNPGEGCGRASWCSVHLVWSEAQAKVKEVLSAAKLDRMAREMSAPRMVGVDGDNPWASS